MDFSGYYYLFLDDALTYKDLVFRIGDMKTVKGIAVDPVEKMTVDPYVVIRPNLIIVVPNRKTILTRNWNDEHFTLTGGFNVITIFPFKRWIYDVILDIHIKDSIRSRSLRSLLDGDYNKAIDADPNVAYLLDDAPEDILEKAVANDPDSIFMIDDPSESLQLLAVSLNPSLVVYLDDPSEKVLVEAVANDYRVYWKIKRRSEAVREEFYRRASKIDVLSDTLFGCSCHTALNGWIESYA